MRTFPSTLRLRVVIRQLTTRIPLITACLAALLAAPPVLRAQPRLLEDEEMDQVCAKGSTGFDVDPAALQQMVFDFHRQTSLGLVTVSGKISTEVIANPSGKPQILLGLPGAVAGGGGTAARSAMAPAAMSAASGSSAGVTALDAIQIPTTDFQVVNGIVRVRGDVNVEMQTLPSVLRALQQNRLLLPAGFNPLSGMIQGIEGMR
jgi:hypothetical protein